MLRHALVPAAILLAPGYFESVEEPELAGLALRLVQPPRRVPTV